MNNSKLILKWIGPKLHRSTHHKMSISVLRRACYTEICELNVLNTRRENVKAKYFTISSIRFA